jgi:phage shock protein PspC (stress-responsive transcriptional regulator)
MASNDYKMRNVPGRAPGPQPSAAEQKLLSTTQAEVPEERPHSMRSSITAREPRKIAKKRNRVQFLLVLFYIALALVYWILLCQMMYKPYGRKSYFETESDGEDPTGGMTEKLRINERYIRAMYIIKTIVTTLTIPVTGYVCMVAAMSYLQSNATKSRLTLKQSMAVADQRWANPLAWAYAGSLPLYVGFFLMLLGKTCS